MKPLLDRRELALLQLRVGRHAALAVVRGELEHRQVQGVEAGERDELEAVAHVRQAAPGTRSIVRGSSFARQLNDGEQL